MLNWLATSRLLCFKKLNYFQPNVLHILHHFFLAIVYLICDSFFSVWLLTWSAREASLLTSDSIETFRTWSIASGSSETLLANTSACKQIKDIKVSFQTEYLRSCSSRFFPRPHSTLFFSCFSLQNIIFHHYLIGTRKSYHFRRNRICFDNLYHIVQLRRLIHIEHLENKSWI